MSIWPVEGSGANQLSRHKAELAMAMLGKNRHYHFKDVKRRHINSTAAQCFYGADAEDIIERVLERSAGAIERVAARLPTAFPEKVAEKVFSGLLWSAEQLEKMPKT